jgi:hypothetical protein
MIDAFDGGGVEMENLCQHQPKLRKCKKPWYKL